MSRDRTYFYFFSYGSNLLMERIKARVASVEIIQNFKLQGYQLISNKVSKDGSTKANIQVSKDLNHFVWGVIQRIDLSEKPALDRAEGLGYGYELEPFRIPDIDHYINFYFATVSKYIKEGRNPYDWYLDYVIYGAIENRFPKEYIKTLESIASVIDTDPDRREQHDKVLAKYKQHHYGS